MTGLVVAVFLLAFIETGLTCYLYPMPPKISFPQEERVEVRAGSTFTLKCENPFRLKWMTPRNSTERISVEEVNLYEEDIVSIDLYESTFTRTGAKPEDSGYYHCVQLGQLLHEKYTSDNIYVSVVGTPGEENTAANNEEKSLQRVSLSYEFKENNLEITCRALLEDRTPYHMFWQGPSRLARKNGQIQLQRLPLEKMNGRTMAVHKLTVHNMNDINNGLYTCTVTYGRGKENSASLSLSGHEVHIFEETSNEIRPQ